MSNLAPAGLTTQGIEAFLHEKIPLSRALGVRVLALGPDVVLEAPLAPSLNHLGTAFGGSLHALPTLAGYTALWTMLREAGIDSHVVIKSSSARYREPVRGPLRAVCVRPSGATAAAFIHTLQRHQKAGLDLTAIIEGSLATRPAVEFSGHFVAII